MAIGTVGIATPARSTSLRARVSELLDRESWLGPIFVSPAMVLILLLVAYPFCMALYFSVSNAFIGRPSSFIGLRNFINLWDSDAFRQTFQNAFVFCGIAVGANLATSRGRHVQVVTRHEAELPRPSEPPSPERLVVQAELSSAVSLLVDQLPVHERRALVLAATGVGGPEIARSIGRTPGATRTLLCRARAKLRERLLLAGFAGA